VSKFIRNCEKGVTLLELLISLSILSIVLLTFMNFFYQASTFNVANQNKTVALNVARNSLIYMEKQNFIEMRDTFAPVIDVPSKEKAYYFYLKMCEKGYTMYRYDKPIPESCTDIPVNDGFYEVSVFSKYVPDDETKKYYIPVRIEVAWDRDENNRELLSLDGTIKSEDLR
jgi:prepilin-type N-terminal cleavage/methylation domain-containing protein